MWMGLSVKHFILILFFQLTVGQIPHSVRFDNTLSGRPLEDGYQAMELLILKH